MSYTAATKLRKMKKFRFLLLHEWIIDNFKPCKAADIGGGKGMLAYFLNNCGFQCTVIDPTEQPLLDKYKDLAGKKHTIPVGATVPRISAAFEKSMAQDFDILIGLHAHGSNMKILEASAEYGKSFILLPCCVIDEPIEIQPDIDWFESLEGYAERLGMRTKRFELNFSGQNIGFYRTDKP
jgi:hypothetical protein